MTASEEQKPEEKAIHIKYTNRFADKLPTFILGAGTLATALTWNDFSKTALEHYFPKDKNGNLTLKAKFIYAIILTFVIVGIIVLIEILSEKVKENFNGSPTSITT